MEERVSLQRAWLSKLGLRQPLAPQFAVHRRGTSRLKCGWIKPVFQIAEWMEQKTRADSAFGSPTGRSDLSGTDVLVMGMLSEASNIKHHVDS